MKILLLMTMDVKNITTKISTSVGVMRRLHCYFPVDIRLKLYYSLVYFHLTYALLAWGRSGRTNDANIECAHRRAHKLLTDYITIGSSLFIQFMITLLYKRLSTQIPLIFINISKTNYLLINRLICTTSDTEQLVILILNF